jgi:hypothetical protein
MIHFPPPHKWSAQIVVKLSAHTMFVLRAGFMMGEKLQKWRL